MPKSKVRKRKVRRASPPPGNAGSRRSASPPSAPAASRSPVRPADEIARCESFDGFSALRNGLRKAAELHREWAGIPMPLDGERLVVEPTYPKAKELMAMCSQHDSGGEDCNEFKVRNTFWSSRHRCDIVVIETSGKIRWYPEPQIHNVSQQLTTLGCSDAWGIEQEHEALKTLSGLVSYRQFKQYLLTGSFLESSRRSRLTYMFRRLRPTVAIDTSGENCRVRCSLCMHPIAYYSGSWAGAMCPTDDVIAHLMLMRGDEPMFWRRSNQHPPHSALAGL